MTPAQIAIISIVVLLVLGIVYYLSSSSSSSTTTPPVTVPAPSGTAAANSPTTSYNLAANTWYSGSPWQPAGGCPGNISAAAANGWCAMPEAQAEALCSASSDCAGYGQDGDPNWAFAGNYQLYPAGVTTLAQSGATMYNKV